MTCRPARPLLVRENGVELDGMESGKIETPSFMRRNTLVLMSS